MKPFLDLAVIFRPGLISHPKHEMSPKEFELSQSVLEFLIAHQDHFMLDISPSLDDTVRSPRPHAQSADVVPSSAEEISHISPSSWNLVNHISVRPMARRRTTTGRRHLTYPFFASRIHTHLSENPGLINVNVVPIQMSPVTEHPLDRPGDGIKRSRTMPTRRKGADGEAPPRVLRKQRRIPATQPKSPPRN